MTPPVDTLSTSARTRTQVPTIPAGTPIVAAEMTPLHASVAEIDLLRAELPSARQELAQLHARFPEPDNQNGGPT
jgi:hypothetical protein